ncbi:MAG: glycosyltransferase [Candidatus Azobacteroides sp.]|nr:glycosyltransferase [Candidatus Azobacteroides sp.]
MSPKVSILVPIYNVSNYIERCAHSLFQQTFDDIEYVFINDCTPDDSIEKLQKVIEQYPNRKPFVKIINHEKNRGLAAARNTAIDNSTGEYILVVDSDDYIELNMVEELYLCAEKEDADIAVSDIMREYSDRSVLMTDYVSSNWDENVLNILLNQVSVGSLWNKLIKRELYVREDCRVPEGLNFREDIHVIFRIYFYANKIVKIDRPFYHYVYNETSIMGESRKRMHFENIILFWKLMDSFLIEKNLMDKYKNDIQLMKVENKIGLMFGTNDCKLRREFADIFLSEERKVKSKLKGGKRIMLFFVRHKLFGLAHLHRQLIVLKQKLLHIKNGG